MSKAEPSYKELKAELDRILAALQHPDTDVDEALELHKQGQKALDALEKYLAGVTKKVAKSE